MSDKVNGHDCMRVDYLPQLNYAVWLNGQQCLRRVEIDNQSNNDWKDVTVSLTGDLLVRSEEHVELISRGQAVALRQLQIVPDSDTLRQLTEKIEIGRAVQQECRD